MTFKLSLDSIKLNQHAKCLFQKLLSAHAHTHTPDHLLHMATKVLGIIIIQLQILPMLSVTHTNCDHVHLVEYILSVQVMEWNVQGLHMDRFSIQNGSLVTRGRKQQCVLLLIDPQSVGMNWIINMESSRDLQVSPTIFA